MKSIGGVLLAVIILLVMVTIHELGHYIAGKILRFKITEFSVGFGPALFKKRSKKTGELFAVRLIPLGGYCAFDGEDSEEEETVVEEEEPFEERTSETNFLLGDGDLSDEVQHIQVRLLYAIAQQDAVHPADGLLFIHQVLATQLFPRNERDSLRNPKEHGGNGY